MSSRWAGIAKYKLEKVDSILEPANMLGLKCHAELSGRHENTTSGCKKRERLKQISACIFNI
jgi:hypothetical protein